MSTIFSKIIAGEIPSYTVAEDDKHLAFLDVFPLRKGHTLVIPKREEDDFFDLTNDELADLMAFAKKVAAKIKANFSCKKVGMSVVGLEVPHAHIHLIPIHNVSDMNFAQPKLELSADEMKEIAARLSQ